METVIFVLKCFVLLLSLSLAQPVRAPALAEYQDPQIGKGTCWLWIGLGCHRLVG